MKWITGIILVLAVSVLVVAKFNVINFDNLLYFSYCDEPILYRIDTVDPRFNLSKEEFAENTAQAAQIWNDAYPKKLFTYDPKGELSINLIYDERQSLTTQINKLENKLKDEKQSLTPKVVEYKKLAGEFEQKLEDFKKEVDFWNSQGGAPPEQFNKLKETQEQLEQEADRLNKMAESLNISADAYNNQVSQLDQTINTFNDSLLERPEEGIFIGPENRIEVYFNINEPELVHTLAHELGHALGIKHVGNKASIMYAKTSQKLVLTQEDLSALEDVCKKYPIYELMRIQLAKVILTLQSQLNKQKI